MCQMFVLAQLGHDLLLLLLERSLGEARLRFPPLMRVPVVDQWRLPSRRSQAL